MRRYRIEVGREHGVEAKHVVGAIANEAGLDSRNIGHIKFYDDYSTVDLPDGMPKEVFKHLQKVWVCGRQLQLSPLGEPGTRAGKPGKAHKPHKAKGRSNADRSKSGGKRS
jgi:ATP-dependent RNA helicase DeaD